MQLPSAIYVSLILSLTAVAAPLAHPSRGDALVAISREAHDTPVLAARMGGDVFQELDLTAREVEIEVNARVLDENVKPVLVERNRPCVIA
ncbi:hypothetical protein FB451DRAFT_1313523 [Mycena latifolia]|nr:hypothetical protein FB451DRAFT_1313523 [Mycena latifolia]